MEKNFVLNGNKLIAQFMGYEYIPFKPKPPDDKVYHRQAGWWIKDITPQQQIISGKIYSKRFLGRKHSDLRYYNSWDWLMPVVKKCIDLGIFYSEYTNGLHDALLSINKEQCFNVVVEFISKGFYNEKVSK